MTIKEVEQTLNIPRATVRYYEREGLLEPKREENGYRGYSENDVERIKEIVVLRKLGISISEISDIFDGAKSMYQIICENEQNLMKQMDELRGALKLSEKMRGDAVEMDSFEVDEYWDIIDSEEKQGNRFIDITKDLGHFEKEELLGRFYCVREDGKSHISVKTIALYVIAMSVLLGCINCLMCKAWTIGNVFYGFWTFAKVIAIEAVLIVPVFLLSRKWLWLRGHIKAAILCMASFVFAIMGIVVVAFKL